MESENADVWVAFHMQFESTKREGNSFVAVRSHELLYKLGGLTVSLTEMKRLVEKSGMSSLRAGFPMTGFLTVDKMRRAFSPYRDLAWHDGIAVAREIPLFGRTPIWAKMTHTGRLHFVMWDSMASETFDLHELITTIMRLSTEVRNGQEE